mmetsp:Transcript_22942/g.33863  ORF Transcript_22942/g.33863 Transcript_22942/m.33863 type:complete len:772 (+) Transcript_22942:157-2472(+)
MLRYSFVLLGLLLAGESIDWCNSQDETLMVDEAFMQLVVLSADLTAVPDRFDGKCRVKDSYSRPLSITGNVSYFCDDADAAAFVQQDGRCYLSFRGTDFSSMSDITQNLNAFRTDGCNKDNECCKFHSGFANGWKERDYKDNVTNLVRGCAESCENLDDCLVITGHSQGGAIAIVTSVIFSDLNPKVVTFGAPGTIVEPCDLVNSTNHYRFINSLESKHDIVPHFDTFTSLFKPLFVGWQIKLSDQDKDALYVAGLDADEKFKGLGFKAHRMFNTIPTLSNLIESAKNAPLLTRFNNFVTCGKGKECVSERCAKRSKNWFAKRVCQDKAKLGERCSDHSDCESGYCDMNILDVCTESPFFGIFSITEPPLSTDFEFVKGTNVCVGNIPNCQSSVECTAIAYGPCFADDQGAPEMYVVSRITGVGLVDIDKYLKCNHGDDKGNSFLCNAVALPLDTNKARYQDYDVIAPGLQPGSQATFLMNGDSFGNLDYNEGGYIGISSYFNKGSVEMSSKTSYVAFAVRDNETYVDRSSIGGSPRGAPYGPAELCVTDADILTGECTGEGTVLLPDTYKFSVFGYTDFQLDEYAQDNIPPNLDHFKVRMKLDAVGFTLKGLQLNGEDYTDEMSFSNDVDTVTIFVSGDNDDEIKEALGLDTNVYGLVIDFPKLYNKGPMEGVTPNGPVAPVTSSGDIKVKITVASDTAIYIDYLFEYQAGMSPSEYFIYSPAVTVVNKSEEEDAHASKKKGRKKESKTDKTREEKSRKGGNKKRTKKSG